MADWLQPAVFVDELPTRPVPLSADDPIWRKVPAKQRPAYIENTIVHGLQWVAFEPNAEPLWALIHQQVDSFLTALWRDGYLAGDRPQDAFYVNVNRTTMTQDDIDHGRLVIDIGLATTQPDVFVAFRIGMWVRPGDDPDQNPGL